MRHPVGLALLVFVAACNQSPKPLALPAPGTYVGLESMGPSHQDVTPDDTTDHWYHENRLTIRGDSAFLERVPVVIKDHEKGYSSSDGGFYSYRGPIRQYPDSLVAHLLLGNHDYVLLSYRLLNLADTASALSLEELAERGRAAADSSTLKKRYPLLVSTSGLVMNGVRYRLKK